LLSASRHGCVESRQRLELSAPSATRLRVFVRMRSGACRACPCFTT